MRSLCLLALVLACGWAAAAPAPLPKPPRNVQRPVVETTLSFEIETIEVVVVPNLNLNALPPLGALPPSPPAPAQPPNADPPG